MSAQSTLGPFTSPSAGLRPLTAAQVRSRSPLELARYIGALSTELRTHTHPVGRRLPHETRRQREGRWDLVRTERVRRVALEELGADCVNAVVGLNGLAQANMHGQAQLVAEVVRLGDDVWQEVFAQLELGTLLLASQVRGAHSTLASHLLHSIGLQLDEMANGNARRRSVPLVLGEEEHTFK